MYQLLKTDICQQLIARSFKRFYLGQVNYVVLRCSFRLKDKIKFSSHFDPKDTSLFEASVIVEEISNALLRQLLLVHSVR